jgi:predicted nucleic acid-binding protein
LIAFVLDASVILAWAFDERFPNAEPILTRVLTEETVVPQIWWFELRNVLVQGERRGRIAETQTARFLGEVARLAVTVDQEPQERGLLALARRHRLTVYDAAYLELAIREGLPLATFDKALVQAARAEFVPLIGATS